MVDYEGIEDLVTDYTANLSTGGTFVHTDREFEDGTEVRLVLSFPGLLKPLAIDGVVRWTQEGETEDRGVGIEFVNYGDDVRERLEEILAAIAKGDPRYVGRLIKILLVEDNPHVAKLIREGIGESSHFEDDVVFKFRLSNNGRDALDRLHTEEFDAVIIDVYIPVLDGSSVIAAVRADEKLCTLPIIAVSAGGPAARESALEAGADFFLEKPMRLREVIRSMKRLINLGESS